MTDRKQIRRDSDTVRAFLRDADYFDTEDDSDKYVEALAALDRIMAELEQAERERDDGVAAFNEVAATADRFEARLAKVPALVENGAWYIKCLEDVLAGKVVRGLAEAQAGYESALAPWEQE